MTIYSRSPAVTRLARCAAGTATRPTCWPGRASSWPTCWRWPYRCRRPPGAWCRPTSGPMDTGRTTLREERAMPTITIELSDDDARQLAAAAEGRGQTATGLAQRWVQERLVHERERAAGGGKPMSPRARRE